LQIFPVILSRPIWIHQMYFFFSPLHYTATSVGPNLELKISTFLAKLIRVLTIHNHYFSQHHYPIGLCYRNVVFSPKLKLNFRCQFYIVLCLVYINLRLKKSGSSSECGLCMQNILENKPFFDCI